LQENRNIKGIDLLDELKIQHRKNWSIESIKRDCMNTSATGSLKLRLHEEWINQINKKPYSRMDQPDQ
jgi:hypothetical protein